MKKEQRNLLLKKRGALNRSFIRSRSAIISKKVYEFLKKGKFHFVASYNPYNNEANPNLYLSPNSLFFPKVESEELKSMSFYRGKLSSSFKGIKEPKLFKQKIFKKNIDVILVPGVGFDERGFRIGYGAGFYDRFLNGVRAVKVGVTFDCCIVDRVENSKNDEPVDVVITEKRKIFCKLRR